MKQWPVLALLLVPLAAARGDEAPPLYRLVKMKLRPAAPALPALRYRLLPEVRDIHSGNAALCYYRSFAPEWITYTRPEIAKKLGELTLKPGERPPADFRWALTARFLDEIERGAHRSYCDWEQSERLREKGIGTLLPDLQGMRQVARVLQLKARFEMFEATPEKVHQTLQTGLMFGRHVSDGPTLIQSLVGNAITGVMLGEVEEWIQRPGAPNLYWPLTDLPRPFIDLRQPLQGEKLFLDQLLPGVRQSAAGKEIEPMALEQLRKIPPAFFSEASLYAPEDVYRPPALPLLNALAVARLYPAARQALIGRGRSPEQVDRLPMAQVVLLEEIFNYERYYDDMMKWYGAPYAQAHRGLQRYEEDLKRLRNESHQLTTAGTLATLLLPAVSKVFFAAARTDRSLELLRCVEALRLHAAAHDGKLPAHLEDITEVPIPSDPVTGKPFEYTVKDNEATLFGPPPEGEQPQAGNSFKYEITLVK